MKILLIQLRQLGDILLTTPCIREIRRVMPDASIDFCCHRMGRLILNGNPYINHILEYVEGQSFREQYSFLKEIYNNRYDVVIDFMNNPRSAIICAASRAPKRVGFRSSRSYVYNTVVPKPDDNQYIVNKKFHLLVPMGIEPQDIALDFPYQSSKTVDGFFALLQTQNAGQMPYIILSPTHRRELRQWPIENWAALAKTLETQHNAKIIWIWGPGEKDFVLACHRLAKGHGVLSPETKLNELGYLISRCQLFIGNSNGPSHIAVAVGTPSLQLHGPTNAIAWCPNTEQHRYIQSQTGSMADISLDQVLENTLSFDLQRRE